ncbi:MAG: portal protein [Komagataeibacter saccharivorans]|uniref:portal protein n=1 Tax=Komagataeibacter saccharivorans TaxID=265959 RepID=UPI0039E961E6
MDWQELKKTYPRDPDLPPRAHDLAALGRVLAGTQYDAIPNPFGTEYNGAGEYIPLARRRPSVRTNMCRAVVDDAVSLLFGASHWPATVASDPTLPAIMAQMAAETALPALMTQAATRGSVGSVAVLVEAVDRHLRFQVHDTLYLTPQWDADGTLASVTERYKVTGAILLAQGWPIAPDDMGSVFWWQRVWDRADCHVYVPQRVDAGPPARVDATRGTHHGLGFVPWVWMANLAAPGVMDGPCTFAPAIDTVIECDYLLSQAGRGLKYSADPRLVIRAGADPYADGTPASSGGAAAALTLPLDGDAKLLEINGDAAGAMRDHYRELRASVMEQIHGNRAQADSLSAPTSGRAMEMLYQPLLWLADRMRLSYGEYGLLALYRMACRFSQVIAGGIRIGGVDYAGLDPAGLALQWPPYFPGTEAELAQLAQGLGAAVQGGFVSRQTACTIFAARAGCPAPHAEWARIVTESQT